MQDEQVLVFLDGEFIQFAYKSIQLTLFTQGLVNLVNTMPADVLTSCIARASIAVIDFATCKIGRSISMGKNSSHLSHFNM